MTEIPKPPEYWRWRRTKRTTWETAIQHPNDSFIASDLDTPELTTQTVGHAMRDLCEDGYFTREHYYKCRWKYVYSAEQPFMAYKEAYRRGEE